MSNLVIFIFEINKSFVQMHANGDEQILIPDVFENETFEVW